MDLDSDEKCCLYFAFSKYAANTKNRRICRILWVNSDLSAKTMNISVQKMDKIAKFVEAEGKNPQSYRKVV